MVTSISPTLQDDIIPDFIRTQIALECRISAVPHFVREKFCKHCFHVQISAQISKISTLSFNTFYAGFCHNSIVFYSRT